MTGRRRLPAGAAGAASHRRPAHACGPAGEELHRLLQAARAGEPSAWRALVARFDPFVRAIARRHHLQPAEQEDVAQRVWMRLLRHADGIREAAALPAWLKIVARNESLRALHDRREVPLDGWDVDEAADPQDVEEEAVAAERRRALHRAIDELPDSQRELMRLLATDPAPTYDEVSGALGIPKGSIGPTRQRCLDRLRRDPHLARAVDATGHHREPRKDEHP